MNRRIQTVLFGLVALTIPSCNSGEPCTTCGQSPKAAPAKVGPAAAPKRLEPWEAVDPAFVGCQQACGTRSTGPSEGVVVQPGATLGQRTYCPVSGAVFEVTATSQKRDFGGRTLYFCCESCATYFSANSERIAALRGFAP